MKMVQCVAKPMSCTSWKLHFVLGVLLIWKPGLAGAQEDCILSQVPTYVEINETEPPGRALLNLPGGPGATWTFRIRDPGPPNSDSLAPYFRLEPTQGNATVFLDKMLDLEEIAKFLQEQSTIEVAIICSRVGATDMTYQWFVTVNAINEFAPVLVNLTEGGFNIGENARVGDTILVLKNYVEDRDVVPNHLGYSFALLPHSDAAVDGRQKFTIGDILTGAITVQEPLDYEAMTAGANYYLLNVSVADGSAQDQNGLTSTQTVRINVLDADDLPPEFYYPECQAPCFTYYTAAIEETFLGDINWLEPAPIQARDQDSLNSPIFYRLKKGDPDDFGDYITIDSQSAVPRVIKPVADTDVPAFYLIVEAVEDTPLQHSQQTSLVLKVKGRNSTEPTLPPVIVDGDTDEWSAFRTATIVLGVLFGLVIVVFVIFIVCSMSGTTISAPVLPKAIGRLASSDDGESRGTGHSANSTRRKSKKSVTLAKSSDGSRLDFMRSITRRGRKSPTLKSYTASPDEDMSPDIENLAVSNEIDYQHNAVDGGEDLNDDLPPLPPVSTISDSTTDVAPFEDRYGLMYGAERMGQEESGGMANPAFGMEREADDGDDIVDHGVVPMEPTPDYV